MQLLGNSLEEIAQQKAGIIKPGIPVVVGTVPDCIHDIAAQKNAPLVQAKQAQTNLLGKHQEYNAGIAQAICQQLGISDAIIHTGLMMSAAAGTSRAKAS